MVWDIILFIFLLLIGSLILVLLLPFTLLMRGFLKYSAGKIESTPEFFFGVGQLGLTLSRRNLYFGYGKRRFRLYRFDREMLISLVKTRSEGKNFDHIQLSTIIKIYRSVASGLRLKVVTLTGYYGFKNPMQTGQISGVISAIKHILPEKTELKLTPVFGPRGLPEVHLEGRIIIDFRPVVIGINIIKKLYK